MIIYYFFWYYRGHKMLEKDKIMKINKANIFFCQVAHDNTNMYSLYTIPVADRVPPDVEGCPNDIFVEVPAGVVSTNVNWDEPRAEDDIGEVTMTYQSHSSRDAFLVGTTTVIYTWEDTAGNYAECRFYVTVTVGK